MAIRKIGDRGLGAAKFGVDFQVVTERGHCPHDC